MVRRVTGRCLCRACRMPQVCCPESTHDPNSPAGTAIRVVGDVHGDATAFAYAAATDRFVLQLGDLVDNGPDSAGALRIMFQPDRRRARPVPAG